MNRLFFKAIISIAVLLPALSTTAWAKSPSLPDYMEKADAMVAKAATAGAKYQDLSDDILIARNFLRNANSEYEKNLGTFSGKLDSKYEPVVRQLSEMASMQSALVIARAGAKDQERERIRLDDLVRETKSKIKVFDDLVAMTKGLKRDNADQQSKIAGLEAKLASLSAELSAKGSAISSSDQKTTDLLKALDEQKKATASSEQRVATLSQELENLKQQTSKLQASEQQLEAQNRIKTFESEVGKLGGIVKQGSSGLAVWFPRSEMIKQTGKSITITPEGKKKVSALAGLMNSYPEYRMKLRVHGFGQPSRNEDPAATDHMARFLREALVTGGKLDPSTVEALGVGAADPAYPKNNVEGNRRVEIIFLKK